MKKKLKLFIFCSFFSIGSILAQTQNIKGIVVDEVGEPVIGASVSVKGTTNATMTDVDGKFNIVILTNVKTLTFTYIGYKMLDVPVQPNMRVEMSPTSQQLSEVVVTGMGTMDRRLFTGATDRLGIENVKLEGIAEISRGLEGRSAGVTVQNVSGTFGAAPRIQVRGATSIYGDSKPLWVVDGVIVEDVVNVSADDLSSGNANTLISSAIAGLNSEDIEDIQILKDGSATSVYGARAMGGVVVITTKKGTPGISSINYTGEFTYRLKPMYRDFNIMNSQDQMGVYKEMENKGWLTFADSYRASQSGVYGKMYQLINTYDPVSGTFALQNTPEARNAYLRSAEMRNTDWFDELFQTNVMQNHSVSVSGGTDKTRFYGSISALIDPGWTLQSKVNRYTARLNVTHNIINNLFITLSSTGSYRKQNAPGTIGRDVNAVTGEVKRDFDINPYSYAMNTSRTLDRNTFYTRSYAPFNILHELENNNMNYDILDLNFQAELNWQVLPSLSLKLLGSIKQNITTQDHFIRDKSNQAEAYRAMPDATVRERNPLLYGDPDNIYALNISVLPEGGIYRKTDYKMYGYDFRFQGNYNKTFNEVHSVLALGGMEVNLSERNEVWFNGWGMQYSMGEIPFYVYQLFKQGIEQGNTYYTLSNTNSRHAAFFLAPTYGYDNRYVLQGTIRYEGSNRLGKSSSARWLPTWNVGAAWNISEEKFFQNWEPTVSHLKLFGSYSLTADLPPGSIVSNSKIQIGSYTPYRPFANVKEPGLNIVSNENSELTYEKKKELSIGLESGFLKNRINTSLSWYRRQGSDLIGLVNTPGVGGELTKFANTAKMRSWGTEVSLTTRNVQLKDFSWTTNFIYSYAKQTITDLKNSVRVMDMIQGNGFALEGYDHRALFSIPFVKLNDEGIPVFTNEKGEETSTSISFQERELLDYLVYEGPTIPRHTGSLHNTLKFKDFTLGIFFTYGFGNKIRLNPEFSDSYSDLSATPKEFKNRWVMAGDEKITKIPVIASTRQVEENSNLNKAYNAYNYSTERVAKGDYIKLQEMSINYDFPKKWRGDFIKTLSVKLLATNLFYLYTDKKLNGQDPIFFQSGGVAAPVPRQFTFTLRLGL